MTDCAFLSADEPAMPVQMDKMSDASDSDGFALEHLFGQTLGPFCD